MNTNHETTNEPKGRKIRFRAFDLVLISLGAALMAVCAWISIPTPVPFTLQTFCVFCLLTVLGGVRGTVAILVYLMLGAVGLPVFAGFRGGISALLGPTGGYLLGFLLTGLCVAGAEHLPRFKGKQYVSCTVGLLLCYLFGTIWFQKVYSATNGAMGFSAALMTCVVPFLLPDAVKLVLGITVGNRISKILRKDGFLTQLRV